MLRTAGAGLLTLVTVVVIVIVAAVPLLLVHRSTCREAGEQVQIYSFVLPWDEPPQDCRDHQRGIEVVAEEIGL